MNKKLLTLLLAAGIALSFTATVIYAGTEVADEIIMNYNKYEKRLFKTSNRNFVKFTHTKHNIDYNIACDQCHHIDLKIGDDVKQCAECHIELKVTKKNSKSIMLLRNAYHASCIECHKEFNKEAGDPRGFKASAPPTSCSECHVRTDVKQKK
jgi:hypothetical protein